MTPTLVLVRTQGPMNLGMVARLCGNLGIDDLRLVAPRCSVDDADARRFATTHAAFLDRVRCFSDLPAATADVQAVVGTAGELRDGPLALEPAAVAPWVGGRRWALVFGNEADGLSVDELAQCHAVVRLPAYGPVASYNLACAVAIAGHLVVHQATAAPAEPSWATVDELHRVADAWTPLLHATGAVPAARPAALAGWRRMLHRMRLDGDAAGRLTTLAKRVAGALDRTSPR